ncbi:hypothetical protein LIER_10175 [Lithospermum erythrorhizon]|uniref:CCHC-type domain-containing protein n=1 Tax=Lithospermum erythrorhizon TaxID=34254 RepID=A0AAV3PL76_LITER
MQVEVSTMQVASRFNPRSDQVTSQYKNNKALNQFQPYPKPQNGFMKEDKLVYKCDNCGKIGHLRKDCFKLKGFPNWWP